MNRRDGEHLAVARMVERYWGSIPLPRRVSAYVYLTEACPYCEGSGMCDEINECGFCHGKRG